MSVKGGISLAASPASVAAVQADLTSVKAVTDVQKNHLRVFTGTIYYADAARADDTGAGTDPDVAKKTIAAGLALLSAGDMLRVKAGTYDEDGLDMALNGLTMEADIGVKIVNTVGTECFTVSGDHCHVHGVDFEQAGAIGLVVTGEECHIEDCRADGTTVGFDVNGAKTLLRRCQDLDSTVTGFDIATAGNLLDTCTSIAAGGASRGYYLSAAGADQNILLNCHSLGKGTAGFETVAGANYNKFAACSSGGGDGATVDAGEFNDWPLFVDTLDTDEHEHIYPISTGQGDAADPVSVSNATIGGQALNFFGDVVRIVPPDTLTTRWLFVGLYIHAVTAADVQQWQVLFTHDNKKSAQNAGNAWAAAEVDLTVVDGSLFENGDLVWVTGADRAEGEIMLVDGAPAGNVVTLARETNSAAGTGLRYAYTATGVGNTIYLVRRAGSGLYQGFDGDYSAAGAREYDHLAIQKPKRLAPNGGMLIRMLNATDAGASSFDARAIYKDR